jgi:hypothetical protein
VDFGGNINAWGRSVIQTSVACPSAEALQSWETLVSAHAVAAFAYVCLVCPPQYSPSCAESPPTPSPMAPYDFDAPDADAVFRSSDGKELRVHRLILGLSSPVFQSMFGLPQPTESPSELPIIDVPESSDILQPFLQYLYPRSPPSISDISIWAALYAVADKYGAEVVTDLLRDMLIPRFLETSPLRVYALASRWGFEEEAKIASRRTLTMDMLNDFPQEDAELMGGAACHRLYLLHFNRREAARALITSHPRPSAGDSSCRCPPPPYARLVPALCQRVTMKPWLTTEELYEEVAKWSYPTQCSGVCRNTIGNMHGYFSSILRMVSELPQTI